MHFYLHIMLIAFSRYGRQPYALFGFEDITVETPKQNPYAIFS